MSENICFELCDAYVCTKYSDSVTAENEKQDFLVSHFVMSTEDCKQSNNCYLSSMTYDESAPGLSRMYARTIFEDVGKEKELQHICENIINNPSSCSACDQYVGN